MLATVKVWHLSNVDYLMYSKYGSLGILEWFLS